MKIKHLLMMAAAVAFVAVGCKKDDPKDDTLTVSPEKIEFEAAGGDANITITTNLEWTAEVQDAKAGAHFTLDKTSGMGNATIKVTAPAANDADFEAVVAIKAGNKVCSVKVTQKGGAPATAISVVPASIDVVAAGETKVVKVSAADKWTLSNTTDWVLTTVKGGAKGDTDVAFTISANTGGDRTAKVTFTCGGETAELTINQIGAKDPLKITSAEDFVNEILNKRHDVLPSLEQPEIIPSSDTTYTIENDLDFSGYEIVYENAGAGQANRYSEVFRCNIDGKGHTIKNLKSKCYLIQKNSGIMKDLTFDESCSVEFTNHSGGIFLEANYGGKVINIVNKGTVTINIEGTTTLHFGGIMGINRAYVEGCKNYGLITYTTSYSAQGRIGGIIGSFAGSPDEDGIVDHQTDVINCENYGNIISNGAGLEGKKKDTYLGGIVGFMSSDQEGSIKGCKNEGQVSSEGDVSATASAGNYVGGIVGCYKFTSYDCVISDCISKGNVRCTSGDKGLGGVIGYLYGVPTIDQFVWAEGCTINCAISGVTAAEAGDNPCANAGFLFGKTDIQNLNSYFGTAAKPMLVGGTIACGETTVTANSGNLTSLCNGAACDLTNFTINATLNN